MREGSLPAPVRCGLVAGQGRARSQPVFLVLSAPILFLVWALALSGPVSAGEWRGQRVIKDGVLHVLNPAEPMEPPEVYEMHELWRLESETPEGEVVFGAPSAIRWDGEGNSYILDTALWTIHVISPAGEIVRRIGRQGEGPGEFREAGDFFIDRDSRLGIVDFRARQITYFDRDGTPIGNWRADSTQALQLCPSSAWPMPDGILLSCRTFRLVDSRRGRFDYSLNLYDLAGRCSARIWTRTQMLLKGAEPLFDEEATENLDFAAVDTQGKVYVAPIYSRYSIEVFSPQGYRTMVIQRDYQPVRRTETQLSDARMLLDAKFSEWRNAVTQARDCQRDVMALNVRSDGMLWVETSRGWLSTPPGVALVADLYDANGTFRRQAIIRGEIDGWHDFLSVNGSRALRITSAVSALKTSMGATTQGEQGNDSTDEAPVVIICYDLRAAK